MQRQSKQLGSPGGGEEALGSARHGTAPPAPLQPPKTLRDQPRRQTCSAVPGELSPAPPVREGLGELMVSSSAQDPVAPTGDARFPNSTALHPGLTWTPLVFIPQKEQQQNK